MLLKVHSFIDLVAILKTSVAQEAKEKKKINVYLLHTLFAC